MNKLFWGFIFVFLNFNIDLGAVRIGLIPTFVGYLLFYAGLSELAEESPRFEKRRPFCIAMMVYTGIFWVCDFFGLSIIVPPAVSILLSLVSSAFSLYISYGIVWGIGDIEDSNRYTLLGVARLGDAGIEVGVHPMLIPESHPLANVNDAFNAVFLHGDAVDDAMFMGRGAGEMPTASAVVGDIIDAARNLRAGCTGRIGCSCYKDLPIRRAEDCESRYFFRLQAEDRPGVLASIASVFGNNGVSIAQVIQKTRSSGLAELVIITDRTVERHFADSIAILKGMSMVKEISAMIRVYP